jgi:phosphoglycerol transferase MdoB-like AlkP superfamily enzyme
MIQKTLMRFAASFTISTFVLLFINIVIWRRLEITFPHIAMVIGALSISLATTISISLFKIQKINSLIATGLGLVPLLAIPFILRRLYGVVIFRFSFVIFIVVALCALTYALAVIVIAARYKKEEREMNDLLK